MNETENEIEILRARATKMSFLLGFCYSGLACAAQNYPAEFEENFLILKAGITELFYQDDPYKEEKDDVH